MGLRTKPAEQRSNGTNNRKAAVNSNKFKIAKPNKPELYSISATKMETETETETCITTTTYRSSSTSAIGGSACMRPKTLNVLPIRKTPPDQTQSFLGEVVDAWRAKARGNAVPAERTQELFHELSFHPNDKQISEMLQTAKMLARKRSHHSNGLTFGEFCILAADLKRFRIASFPSPICKNVELITTTEQPEEANTNAKSQAKLENSNSSRKGTKLRSTKSLSYVSDCKKRLTKTPTQDNTPPVEVFLGGSCNPTTWRADVAIPTLKKLGITFYNPQVSDWTPDLIELEHRAKEKARVLFFVMDSETRATAGAIEAAHIAGQNCKQLVLVLHPYKPNQCIMNEHISRQEYIDLTRNQMILRELVNRRGLPILENIPLGLQRTKEILAGIRDPPSNIASILVLIRGAFDRVNPDDDVINIEQCRRALLYLGYAQSLLNSNNLNKIIETQRENLKIAHSDNNKTADTNDSEQINIAQDNHIDFELFCVICAYLSVLQQEIHETGCISPIKGTNVPPPPIYLTNMQGDEIYATNYFGSRNISRNSSSTSVPTSNDERQNSNHNQTRDSGTSSPQLLEPIRTKSSSNLGKQQKKILVNIESIETTEITTTQTVLSASPMPTPEDESDSNDSVFSSSSSINSMNFNYGENLTNLDFRDVYLGGSCLLRSKWRQNIAIPYLKTEGVTFHLPALHESIQPMQLQLPEKCFNDDGTRMSGQERSVKRTRRRCEETKIEEEEISEESYTWELAPLRNTLFNPSLLESSRVLLFVITNETRSLAPMTLAAHCIGLMYNVVLAVQMLPDDCVINNEKLTAAAIKDYNRGRSYLVDLAKRQGVPVFTDIREALACTVQKVKACNSRHRFD